MPVHYILVLNNKGTSRISKWYNNNITFLEKKNKISSLFQLINLRNKKLKLDFFDYEENKILYKYCSNLYFIIAIDSNDDHHFYLESLNFFLEILNHYFKNLNELDLISNFRIIYKILDQMYLGGEIQDVLKKNILFRVNSLTKLELN